MPGMPELDVASTGRQRRNGPSELLHDNASHHWQPNKPVEVLNCDGLVMNLDDE
ncbi:hypothetical protein JCM19239_1497 [Vibrio variabilis]|uniref:Uncharacterized protein n=1 Tax=Vibrio variabilis TaxID=990271 RepID=A0ABQ0JG95_9VIBR|nr:hypothetical protein JCM19239_1497 [Vibrio variabilis]